MSDTMHIPWNHRYNTKSNARLIAELLSVYKISQSALIAPVLGFAKLLLHNMHILLKTVDF